MTHEFVIAGLDCPSCVQTVEQAVRKLPGVESVNVRFPSGRIVVEGTVDASLVQRNLKQIGHPVIEQERPLAQGGLRGFVQFLGTRSDTRLMLVGTILIVVALLLGLTPLPTSVSNAGLIGALLVAAWPIARSGIISLVVNRTWTINFLMTIAAVGAVAIGEYLEAATVIVLFALGESLESFTSERARAGLRDLLDLAPAQATRVDGTTLPVAELAVDDLIVVRAGERIPLDGVVTAGIGSVNQAPITGESIPVAKHSADSVWAGSVLNDGVLTIRVTNDASDSTLSRMIRLVEEAQEHRSPTQLVIERFAAWYTPAVMVVALLVALVPPLLGFGAFWDTATTHGWLYRALALLVIACPCALVISAPVTLISGMTAAARQGVLIKGGRALEVLGTLKAIAFDKTGTLTQGEPAVVASRSFDCDCERCATCADVLALAMAVERQSAHPLARAVARAAGERQLDAVYAPASAITTLIGQGVRGFVDGRTVTVGSHALFDAEYPHDAAVCALVSASEAAGHTALLLGDGDAVRGFIAVSDTIRSESRAAVAELNRLDLATVMLTGDNATVARAIADEAGVKEVRAGLLPQHKLTAIEQLRERHGAVAMVGDGINDTPALAAATVGIAIGGAGSAQAAETADVVLMAPHLGQLPQMIRLARKVRRLIGENIALSFATKLVIAGFAIAGAASLWLAILADVGMTLLVTANGLRARKNAKL